MQVTRAKFTVIEKTETPHGFSVKLSPVYDSNPESENGQFYHYTPAGEITLALVRPETAAAFTVGNEYYVDFMPATTREVSE